MIVTIEPIVPVNISTAVVIQKRELVRNVSLASSAPRFSANVSMMESTFLSTSFKPVCSGVRARFSSRQVTLDPLPSKMIPI